MSKDLVVIAYRKLKECIVHNMVLRTTIQQAFVSNLRYTDAGVQIKNVHKYVRMYGSWYLWCYIRLSVRLYACMHECM